MVTLLRSVDVASVLEGFGESTATEDPAQHFYETFLSNYDEDLRRARGVYYTPGPVVSYMVRSVDHLLKEQFACADGLADKQRIQLTPGVNDELSCDGENGEFTQGFDTGSRVRYGDVFELHRRSDQRPCVAIGRPWNVARICAERSFAPSVWF